MTRYFCTYFDHRYLSRGLLLYRSLLKNDGDFKMWVLCMDDLCYKVLEQMDLPRIVLIRLADFQRDDEALAEAKNNRSEIEYYFTCTPSLPLYIFKRWEAVGLITYLDADLWFFSSPEPLFEELGTGSVGIVGHRFPLRLTYLEVFGVYNVGWLTFRRDGQGLGCLKRWRDNCIEWCYDRFEDGRFADQKYLDDWPGEFPGVVVLENAGANVAPWNLDNHRIAWDGQRVLVDNKPLIFFHFHGVKQSKGVVYDLNLGRYGVNPNGAVVGKIYRPYVRELARVQKDLRPLLQEPAHSGSLRITNETVRGGSSLSWYWKGLPRSLRDLWKRRYAIVLGRKVLWP